MKKLLTIIIGCSLALAGGAMAQQDDATPANKKKKKQQAEQGAAQQSQPGANEGRPNQQARPDRQARPGNEARPRQNHKAKPQEHAPDNAPAGNNNAASKPTSASDTSAETDSQGKNAANGLRHGKQMKKEPNAANKTAPEEGTAATSANAETSASTAAQAGTGNPPAKTAKDRTKKPDPQVVQKVKTEHANFKAQARPEKVPAVTFNESYRISGAQQWQGSQYEVFRAYRPARHDQGWYHSHYPRIEIIAGGAYYFNNGYWFPAWGYNPSYQYYAYDAPIYVGSQALPPDRVIADVQAILQEEGYYKGEVDGLLGPLTREALIAYQADNGLYTTATIDEPTLQSLDLS